MQANGIRKHFHIHNRHAQNVDLTKGSIVKGILQFAFPLFLGQLLQQFYNMADAWVVGNFADNDAFAAVSSGGSLTFLIIGFFNGIAIGGVLSYPVILAQKMIRWCRKQSTPISCLEFWLPYLQRQ